MAGSLIGGKQDKASIVLLYVTAVGRTVPPNIIHQGMVTQASWIKEKPSHQVYVYAAENGVYYQTHIL